MRVSKRKRSVQFEASEWPSNLHVDFIVTLPIEVVDKMIHESMVSELSSGFFFMLHSMGGRKVR